ncbi:hypothetical protein [Azospirillum brasilense]|uniref:hypothetical protein n=1 Tax=Azospirillum brasilense TaxID=192 RepID=UPI001478E333|nr:hypothetical protein [Azospirillum brasilense]
MRDFAGVVQLLAFPVFVADFQIRLCLPRMRMNTLSSNHLSPGRLIEAVKRVGSAGYGRSSNPDAQPA